MPKRANADLYVPQTYELATLDVDYEPLLRGFRTAAAGNVSVRRIDGVDVTIASLTAGETFKGVILRINTTGTTVTSPTTNILVLR